MPGRLVFSTTADGASSPTERLRITSAGNVGIGTNSPGTKLHVNTGVAGNLAYFEDGINSDFYIKTASLIATIGPNAGSTSLAFQTSGTERMRINSSGNVGIGTNSPGTKLHVNTGVAGNLAYFEDGINSDFYIKTASLIATIGPNAGSTSLAFQTSGTERMRITGSGSLLCDSTTIIGGDTAPLQADGKTRTALALKGGSNGFFAAFYNTSSTLIGSITGAGGATTFYNTSSDYRIKENVVPLTEAISRVNQLQVHRFNFISHPDQTVDGFIAHEAQEVVPECVTGTKDAVDADGNPVMQGIDQSKLVPLLTAALQEAIAKIEVLEQRLNDAGIN
jgi:hypothetical protein